MLINGVGIYDLLHARFSLRVDRVRFSVEGDRLYSMLVVVPVSVYG